MYSLAGALSADSTPGPVWSHHMAAKLSCLVWSPHAGAAPCAYVADYDGEVTQMDLSTGHFLSSVDGHCGRRCALFTKNMLCLSFQLCQCCMAIYADTISRVRMFRARMAAVVAIIPKSPRLPHSPLFLTLTEAFMDCGIWCLIWLNLSPGP